MLLALTSECCGRGHAISLLHDYITMQLHRCSQPPPPPFGFGKQLKKICCEEHLFKSFDQVEGARRADLVLSGERAFATFSQGFLFCIKITFLRSSFQKAIYWPCIITVLRLSRLALTGHCNIKCSRFLLHLYIRNVQMVVAFCIARPLSKAPDP